MPQRPPPSSLVPENVSWRVITSCKREKGPGPTSVRAPILKKYRVSLSRPCTSALKMFPRVGSGEQGEREKAGAGGRSTTDLTPRQ